MRLDYRVTVQDDKRRAGRLASEKFRLSQHDLAILKQSNGLWADEKPIRQIDRVSTGMLLSVIFPDPDHHKLSSIQMVYEDDAIQIIDKPAGTPTISSDRKDDISLEESYRTAYGEFRPVNRLDKGTGGLMVCATTAYFQHLLSEQLHTDRFIREYMDDY